MSTPGDRTPLGAASQGASPRGPEPHPEQGSGQHPAPEADAPAAPLPDSLSPAVRRLVRQFDLDITAIHGTGPAGRIRVSDVMSLLDGRTDTGKRDAPRRSSVADDADPPEPLDDASPPPAAHAAPAAGLAVPTTTVFECDLARVLAHRKKLRDGGIELLTTSYFLVALASALDEAPEITADHPPRLGVWLTSRDGTLRSALLDAAAVAWDAALDERVRAVDAALRASFDSSTAPAHLNVHHYGESGSVLATPTPIDDGHAASVGIGCVRREVVVRTVNGTEAPRVAPRCYLSLSFYADRVPLAHANRALASAVRTLESWPE
jgi:pyruvate/2-oxoglutarate dehydrogenase complex dihydrolipoamide acyltransferase (E2) component